MCKVIDDVLPVVGAVVGSFIPGLGTAAGAALGGAIGGGISGYAQNHNVLGTLEGAATGGAGGYLGVGGGFGNLVGTLGGAAGAAGNTIAPEAFQAGVTGAANTAGGLESTLGGAPLFGVGAGTGTALSNTGTLASLGGSNLGIAGGDALSGVTAPTGLGTQFGSTGATGSGLPGEQNNLNGVVNNAPSANGIVGNTATQSPATGATGLGGGTQANPVGTVANTQGSLEGIQAAGAPGGDQGAFASGAASNPQTPTNLSSLYGPNSTAAGSVTGQGISGAAGGEGANGILGQAGGSPNGILGSFGTGGQADIPGQSIGGNYTQAANSPSQGGIGVDLSSLFGNGTTNGGDVGNWLKLANTGYNAYQQNAQAQQQAAYANQINNEFSPNSPYAQQMAQTLARQDAAAGRNSQYGTRATQLAAALTQAHAQAMANPNYYKAATSPQGSYLLNSLFSNFSSPQGTQALGQMAGQVGQLGSAAFNGLSNLFS